MKKWFRCLQAMGIVAAGVCVGCVEDAPLPDESASKEVKIDGSSTVFPISQAVAEEFQSATTEVKVVVGTSGTGGGFEKFAGKETDINDASRPIKDSEKEECAKNGVEYLELRIAIDGLSIVVHPENDWCSAMTTAQLKKLWEPNSTVTKWSELNEEWPDKEIKLYGPDTDSGTFDYFTEAICGESGASRATYTSSADDNVLVTGVAGDKYALGYFGYAYYQENKDKLKVLAIADGDDLSKAVAPTAETIEEGTYTPLSRPLFLYVNKAALGRYEVAEFLKFYLTDITQDLISDVGYVPVSPEALAENRRAVSEATKAAGN